MVTSKDFFEDTLKSVMQSTCHMGDSVVPASLLTTPQ